MFWWEIVSQIHSAQSILSIVPLMEHFLHTGFITFGPIYLIITQVIIVIIIWNQLIMSLTNRQIIDNIDRTIDILTALQHFSSI